MTKKPAYTEDLEIGSRFATVIFLYMAVLTVGTLGYHWIESWDFLDSFYMTVITITTVGFGEVHPLSESGKVFTISVALLGVGSFTYTFSTITDYLVKGEIRGFFRERRKKMEIKSLRNHYVVCGFGRVGMQVCSELQQEGKKILVVEGGSGSD